MCHITNCANQAITGEAFCLYHFTTLENLIKQGYSQQEAIEIMNIKQLKAEKAQTAVDFLENALKHLKDRAVTYDNDKGERSIGKTVEMFNILTGHNLSEEQGWKFMAILKLVRSEQGAFKADSYEDGAAYFALAGEAANF